MQETLVTSHIVAPFSPNTLLVQAWAGYLERRGNKLAPRSSQAYEYYFRTLQRYFKPDRSLSSFHEEHFREYQKSRVANGVGASLGTSAEAQAFKRACACFGLGRYFYHFDDVWVDLDEKQRLKETPVLFAWATPEGWRAGLRPNQQLEVAPRKTRVPATVKRSTSRSKQPISGKNAKLIEQIKAMAEPLGRRLYRGLLKSMAHVWKPADIENQSLLNKVLSEMRLAEGELGRLKAAQEKINPKELKLILSNLGIESVDRIDSLDPLQRLVSAVEEKSATT